jgi:multidrug efflux pump subunit AcrA (membrane-fusion protein)
MKMANMRLVAQLTGIQDIAGEQKSVAELQLDISTKQLESLDAQIEQAKSQYDADVAATQAYYDNQLQMAQNQVNELRGINGSVITMTQALAAFSAAVNAERSSSVSNDNERTAAISQMYLDILRRAPDPAGLASWVSSGKSLEDVRAGILGSQEARGFANGGYYPGGMAMVGERGPELIDFNNPGQVYSNDRLRSAMGGGDVATEIRALREDNKIQSRAMVSLQSRMTRLIERWDGDGLPEERLETA